MATVNIQVQSPIKSGRRVPITIDDGVTVAALITAVAGELSIDPALITLHLGRGALDPSATLVSVGVVDGGTVFSANTISRTGTKQTRQLAHLTTTAAQRVIDGNPRDTFDINLLPRPYVGNQAGPINSRPLEPGRPWNLPPP